MKVRSSILVAAPRARAAAAALLVALLVALSAMAAPAEAFASHRSHRSRTASVRQRPRRVHRAHVKKRCRAKPARPTGWRRAKVSWYGPGFYGRGMAGGGKLQLDSMVVAHKRLPFGTLIEFSYKGQTITVPVMDRGPYVAGREFDLGPGPAVALGIDKVGVARLDYRIVAAGQ